MTNNINKKEWDFSFTLSLTVLLILLYFTQSVRLKFGLLNKRNRLTLIIYVSFLLNLVALLIRAVAEILMLNYGVKEDFLIRYAMNAAAMQFYVTAVLIQILEWNLIANMVKFQA